MNKLTDTQKRMIILGIGLLLVLFGLIQGIFKSDFFTRYKNIIDEVTFIMMIFAAMLLFSIKRKPKTDEPAEPARIEETKPEEPQK